jgi:PucR C-terminal helix-turn-helix domain/GGDEF-like domain
MRHSALRENAREALYAGLQARRPEIEQAMLARVYAVSDPADVGDPEYIAGLQAAVSAAVDYGLSGVTGQDQRPKPVPLALLSQARHAARSGVSLDTVLRRYLAGHGLLSDFLIEEVEKQDRGGRTMLRSLLRAQSSILDRILAAVTTEYTLESEKLFHSPEKRLADRVKRLLAGEPLDTFDLPYDFETHHLGLIAKGTHAEEAIRDLAKGLDQSLLLVSQGETVWAWLGARRGIEARKLERLVAAEWPTQLALAIGEPGQGMAGWRLTHQQAKAAFSIVLRSPRSFIRYTDVALLTATLQDDVLATSIRALYLKPLECERDGGEVARQTLRAYFTAEGNVSSAASALGVSRRTVSNRLLAIEESLGCRLSSSAAEIEVALRLHEFEAGSSLSQRTA